MRRLQLLLLCLGMVTTLRPAFAQEVLDGAVAAVVNEEVVTFSQVRELVGPQERKARDTLKGQELVNEIKELRNAAIQTLIDRTLILQSARSQGLTVPESVIDDAIQSIIDSEFGGDRASFLKSITAQGYTFDRYRNVWRDTGTVEKMRAAETRGASTPEEAKQREEKWLHGLRQRAYIRIP